MNYTANYRLAKVNLLMMSKTVLWMLDKSWKSMETLRKQDAFGLVRSTLTVYRVTVVYRTVS